MKTTNRIRYPFGFIGSDYFRAAAQGCGNLKEMIAGWQNGPARFRAVRNRHPIYRGL